MSEGVFSLAANLKVHKIYTVCCISCDNKGLHNERLFKGTVWYFWPLGVLWGKYFYEEVSQLYIFFFFTFFYTWEKVFSWIFTHQQKSRKTTEASKG